MRWEYLWNLLFPTFAAMAAAFAFTGSIRRFALRHGIVDDPRSADRKTHKEPIALLGGLGIMASVLVVLIGAGIMISGSFDRALASPLIAIAAASIVIAIGGFIDDVFALPAKVQFLFPFLASCIVVMLGGVSIRSIQNPFGGAWILPFPEVLTVLWLIVMTYTTKLLDGLDGLATGIGAIGSLMIALLALTTIYFQPDIGLVAAVFFGAQVGFLAWNFNPARIYLGEAGSEFIGFFLGVLAVMAGSKIATALLVVGIPMLDIVMVMAKRYRAGRPVFSGDRRHLHYLLAERLGVRKTVWLLYALSAAFGLMTLSLQSKTKFIALIALVLTAISLTLYAQKKVPQA